MRKTSIIITLLFGFSVVLSSCGSSRASCEAYGAIENIQPQNVTQSGKILNIENERI